MSILKRACLVAVLCTASLFNMIAAPTGIADFNDPITLGQWHPNLAKAKEYSEQNNIPLVYIWGYTGCSYCTKLDGYIERSAFRAWQADRKVVMAYVKAGSTATSDEKNFAKYGANGTLYDYPFIAVYWKSKNSQAYNFTGRYSGGNEEQQFINKIESYISQYTGAPVSSLSIDGSATVNENTATQFNALFNLDSNPQVNVTGASVWNENSSVASILAGLLTVGEVSADQSVKITITYSQGGQNYSATKDVAIKNVPGPGELPVSIEIVGPDAVQSETTAQYQCVLHYSDGVSTSQVTADTSWDESSYFTSINSTGLLTVNRIFNDGTTTVSAEYTVPGGSTFTTEKLVAVTLDAPPDIDPDPDPDPDPIPPPGAGGVTLGEWTTDFDAAKAYSELHDIPMLLVWGYTGCSYCTKLDGYMDRALFQQWMGDRKIVMAYVKASSTASTDEKNFAKYGMNGTLYDYPFIAVYWKSKNSQAYNFTGRYSGGNEEQQFINKIESYISEYSSVPVVPPAEDADDPGDDVEGGASTIDMISSPVAHGPHYLNMNDVSDWFEVVNVKTGTEYRVWISGFEEDGTANLQAEFFIDSSATPWTNMPLADLQSGITYIPATPDDLLIKVSRSANTDATATYTMNVSEWVPCTLGLAVSEATVNAGAGSLSVTINRTGEAIATSATITMANGTATGGADFTATPVQVNWTAGGNNQQTAVIPILGDNSWEPDETFTVILTPNPASAIPGEIVEQTVTIESNIPADSGELAFSGYGSAKERISTRGIPVTEGQSVRLWVERTGGSDTDVAAEFAWSNGGAGFEVAPVVWQHGEEGESFFDVFVPVVEGYQGSVVVTLSMTSADTTVNTRYDQVVFNVSDSEYGDSVRTYVEGNPDIPFSSRYDQWFYPGDGEGSVLRSETPDNVGDSAVLSVTLYGPGVLTFDAAILDAAQENAGSGLLTLEIGYNSPVVIAAENDGPLAFIIPAGRQSITLSFERTAQTEEGDFAEISGINYVKLDEIGQISPLQDAVVVEGTQALVWDNALAPLAGVDGLDAVYVVYAGAAANNMAEVAVIDIFGNPVPLINLPQSTVSTDIDVTPGNMFWRVDVVLETDNSVMEVEGASSEFEVVSSDAPQFAVDTADFDGQIWFDTMTDDGGTVTVNLMVGMDSQMGPFALQTVGDSEVGVQVVSGRLPTGVTPAIIDGQLFLTGAPSRVGEGSVVLRLSEKQDGVTVRGTTLAVLYNVLPLPSKAYGTFEGVVLINNPVTGIDEPGTAKITIQSSGKASGRVATPSGSLSFRTTGFDGNAYYEDGSFVQLASVVKGTTETKFEMMINVQDGVGGLSVTPLTLIPLGGSTLMYVITEVLVNGNPVGVAESMLARNAWRDKDMDALLAAGISWLEGYYTVSIPGSAISDSLAVPVADDTYGNGYLTATVSSSGSVRIGGRLADGSTVSASALLVMTARGAYCEFMENPRGYDNGFFVARLDFISADSLELSAGIGFSGTPLVALTGAWVNFNPEATGQYGEGFARSFEEEISGGYFSKMQSLYDYYQNAGLGFDACYDNWECDTIAVQVNSSGTGFDIPAGGSDANPVYLSLRISRSTGILTIGFRDYQEGSTRYSSLRGYGVITPYFQEVPEMSEIGGRAYILETAVNEDEGYSYNLSTPFALTEDCGCGD